MATVIGFVGGDDGMEVHNCSRCGEPLRGDHGYKLSDGTHVCVRGDKCSMRKTRKLAEGKPMRWRKE